MILNFQHEELWNNVPSVHLFSSFYAIANAANALRVMEYDMI